VWKGKQPLVREEEVLNVKQPLVRKDEVLEQETTSSEEG
jgi:hypothetical protein